MKNDSVRPYISRRTFWHSTLGAAGFAFSLPDTLPGQNIFSSPDMPTSAHDFQSFDASLNGAYSFLNTMMDAYAQGSTIRLVQSYSDGLFAPFSPVAFTYDNAVAIQAYLARGTAEDLQRAQILGNGLIHAQATNFPIADGRFGQAYYVNVADSSGAFITPCAFPFFFYTSAVGDQAWAGMALAQLYRRTHNKNYLDAALKVANWIVINAYDTQGPGGFRFGTNINPSNQSVPSGNGKSTEHNIDANAFFTMLATLTSGGGAANGTSWSSLAQHALLFVQAMFNTAEGLFYTGTKGDQVSIFPDNIPEDVQTWSYLALLSKTYGVSIDWIKTHLATTDTPTAPNSALKGLGNVRIDGVTFARASLASGGGNDSHAVWLEGAAHTAAALLARRLPAGDDIPLFRGDLNTARQLLENIRLAQGTLGAGQKVNGLAIPNGEGVAAASGNLDTGFGFDYFPYLHIGATGWYLIALQAANPFQIGHRRADW
jgi:hypothetical protein